MSQHRLPDVTDARFDAEVRRSPKPVVVDFWAPWCEPCKAVDAALEKIAAKYSGSVKILRLNIDDETETPAQYAVRSIPTLLFFKDGAVANQMINVDSESDIETALQTLLRGTDSES